MYVCVCKAVSDHDIRRAVAEEGVRSFEDLQACTGCSTCCGCCEQESRDLLQANVEPRQAADELPVAA